jgi:hypothetical protein
MALETKSIWGKESLRRPGLLGIMTELHALPSGESGACGVSQLPNTAGRLIDGPSNISP